VGADWIQMSMNETVFKQLFVQLIELSLKQSVPDDSEIPQPDQELAFYRIERIGYQVGQRLVNRLIVGHRLFTDQLDILKYICKDYWLALFQKQIDNLKTNHKVKHTSSFL
jgi:trafficking protein particle complex subunit 6